MSVKLCDEGPGKLMLSRLYEVEDTLREAIEIDPYGSIRIEGACIR